jgi:hypothetical protein
MTLCPIAIVASCSKCPVVGICPAKSLLGDHVPESKAKETVKPVKAPATRKK